MQYFERKLATSGVTYFVVRTNKDGYADHLFPCITGLSLVQADNIVDALTLAYKCGSKDTANEMLEFISKLKQ